MSIHTTSKGKQRKPEPGVSRYEGNTLLDPCATYAGRLALAGCMMPCLRSRASLG